MKLKITVHGVAYEVDVEVLDAGDGFPGGGGYGGDSGLPAPPPGLRAPAGPPAPATALPPPAPAAPGPGGGSVAAPVAGTVVEIRCKPGDKVSPGDVLVVIEAMKMNTNISSPTAAEVVAVPVAVGDSVREGQVLVDLG